MYLVFYDENNKIVGKAFYSNHEHIPNQHPLLEITEELCKSEYQLEIYEVSGKKKVRVNEDEKIRLDNEAKEISTIKSKVLANQDLSNLEMAKLFMSKT